MANPVYLFHIDERPVLDEYGRKKDIEWFAQLRCFNYPGAFSSWVVEEIKVEVPMIKSWSKMEKMQSSVLMSREQYLGFRKSCLHELRKILNNKGITIPCDTEIM